MAVVTKDAFLRAAISRDVDSVRAYFQQPDVAAAAMEIEALIAAAGRPALQLNSSRHVALRRALIRRDAWFYRSGHGITRRSFYKVHGAKLYDTLAWLYEEFIDIPFTLAFLIGGLVRHAASRGRSMTLELLLRSSTFREFLTDDERSALLTEARNVLLRKRNGGSGTLDALTVLIAHGADIMDAFGESWRGGVAMLKSLVDNGAMVIRSTPMRTSGWRETADERIPSLIAYGAHFNNPGNEYLLAEAAAAHVDTVKLILADPCVDIDIHDSWGMSVLMQAIQGSIYSPIEKPSRERLELVEYLLAFDIELDRANHAGETALILASRLGSVEIVGALLARGANPNAQDQTGRTALHWIAMRDTSHHELMRLLLNYGADPTITCAGGRTPLHLLASSRTETNEWATSAAENVTLLIRHGADPNAVDTVAGRTPVHDCVQESLPKLQLVVLEALVNHGGELFYSDGNNITAFDALRQRDDGRTWLGRRGVCID